MGLPDEEARRCMLETKLGECAQGLQQVDLAHMAACTQDFSGSDIAVLAGHLHDACAPHPASHLLQVLHSAQLACCNIWDVGSARWPKHPLTTHAAYMPHTCCLQASHKQSLFASCAAQRFHGQCEVTLSSGSSTSPSTPICYSPGKCSCLH